MKNRKPAGWPVILSVRSRSPLFLLVTGLLVFYHCTVSAQQLPNKKQRNSTLAETVRNTLKKNSGTLQLVENNGQEGLPKNVVAYFTAAYQTVFIEKDRLRVVVAENIANPESKMPVPDKSHLGKDAEQKKYHTNSFTILFSGSTGFTGLEKIKRYGTDRNYIQAGRPVNNIQHAASYGEIILHNVYKGIDLRLYSQENAQLEFDWIIWPGADAGLIKLKFEGQQDLALTAAGNLQVKLGIGNFTMRLPESYYITPKGKQTVRAGFSLAGKNLVQFKGLSSRKNKYPLVIDPDLLWGTFFDGANTSFDEYLYGIEFDYSNELIYCAGAASLQVSTTYAAALSAAYDSTFQATPDALIYAVTKDGQFVKYITYLGGANADVAIGVAVSNSFVYICGYTASVDFPVTLLADTLHPAFDSVYHAGNEGFVAVFNLKLDTLHYCTYLGGDGSDKALTIRAQADSIFYVSLASTDTLPLASPDYTVEYADSIFSGNSEAWIGKFSSFNVLNFGTYVGGTSDDLVNDFQLLSNGDIVFAGDTRNITEVNASIPDNGSGQEALFGRILVPASGPVSFTILDKVGGSNSDYGWGLYSIGDSVSIMVGQTSSNNFPLGTGPVFQTTRNGQVEGFIAKIYNDGSPGYKATFTGGSDDDILVSVRPVVVNNQVSLLAWGTTGSTDLAVRNFNSGTFYSATNTGGLDMLFVICDLDLKSKYYLSYVGGSGNDYLGITGAPVGSNHVFYNSVDSALYLGTTTHSSQTTHAPLFVGRGPADFINTGVPVFDQTKGNSNNDTHVIFAISTRGLFAILPLKWESVNAAIQSGCNVTLTWKTANEDKLSAYRIEKSTDGRNFYSIGMQLPGNGNYLFTDNNNTGNSGNTWYRIAAIDRDGRVEYSSLQFVRPCGQQQDVLEIYPTIVKGSFTITGSMPAGVAACSVILLDAAGKLVMPPKKITTSGSHTFYLTSKLPAGNYFVIVLNESDGTRVTTKKILVTD